MKSYWVLSILILTLISGPVVAGNIADHTGEMVFSGADREAGAADQIDTAQDDGFEADIFHEDQAEQSTHAMVADPLEGFNRAVFVFNDKIYMYGLRPIAKGYARVVPIFARRGVKNFFNNLVFPIRFVNDLLQ
ncbi:MlaA family lipoprotein, partial [Desulfobacter sp.]|uniref:MlaA family lipoprotein n=1 Tax=Desulfobacter sp. TaxID=2294 RepID=UPI002579EF8D